MRLHRHSIWATSKRQSEEALREEGWSDVETGSPEFRGRCSFGTDCCTPSSLVAHRAVSGTAANSLTKDVRILREPLRDARNAVFHVERDVDYYDDRFPGIVRQSAVQLTREHKRPEFAQSQASPFVKPKSSALRLSRARNATKSDASGRKGRQPAATGSAAASPLRAAFEWSRLSREEISSAARIAPATAKPAPTRNA